MAYVLDRNFDFLTNGTVTSAGLHNLIDDTNIYAGLISTQAEKTTVGTADLMLVADSSSIGSPQIVANRTTVFNLFEDALTSGTYVNAQLSGNLTYGTATGRQTISTGATITNGTITNSTTTNGTIASAVIPSATFGTTTSTFATITKLSTTLAGDFAISQGTGTLGTSGATAATYGTTSAIPRITVDAKGRVTAASEVTAPVGFRNRIINGDMRIDQRNAGASVTPTANSYTTDRFTAITTQASKLTYQQVTDAPDNFVKSLKVTVASTFTPSASDQFRFGQVIEGFNIADLGFGTASAQSVTISFRAKASVAGTYSVALWNYGNNRSFVTTVSLTNSWAYYSFTATGDTTGTWDTGNSGGIELIFDAGGGSNFVAPSLNAWQAGNYFRASGSVSLVGNAAATLNITGVQLEAGSTATDFERRPIGTELALCQRYYETSNGAGGKEANTDSFVVTTAAVGNYPTFTYKVGKRGTTTLTPTFAGGTSATFVVAQSSFYQTTNHSQPSTFGWNASAEL